MATAYKAAVTPLSTPTVVGVNVAFFKYVMAGAFVIADTIQGPQIPPGAELFDYFVDFPQLDSSVSPAVTIDLGTDLTVAQGGVDVAGFDAIAIVGNSATINIMKPGQDIDGSTNGTTFVHGSIPFYYRPVEPPSSGILPPKCYFQIKIHAAPTTATTTGTIYGWIAYTMVNQSGGTAATAFL